MNKKISACIITYNHESYIRQCIEGALKQKTDYSYEINIFEDCSTDKTREIILEYKEKYPDQINLFLNEKNLGLIGNWIKALQTCEGEYIAICEGDDYWTDEKKLQKQVSFLEKNPDFALSMHNANILRDGQITGDYCDKNHHEIIDLEYLLTYGSGGPTCSLVIKNKTIKNLPDWFFQMKGCDWLIQIISSTGGNMKYFKDIMGVYRKHNEGAIYNLKRNANLQNISDFSLAAKYTLEMIDSLNKHFNYKYDKLLRNNSAYWHNIDVDEYLKINNVQAAKKNAIKILNLLKENSYTRDPENIWLTKKQLLKLRILKFFPAFTIKYIRKFKNYFKIIIRKFKSAIIKLNNFRAGIKNAKRLDKIYLKYKEYSMIRKSTFIDNLQLCQKYSSVEGCVVECGVWRGGMIASIADIFKDRKYYLFDSFEGLPAVKEIDGVSAKNWQNDKNSKLYFDNCKASVKDAEEAMFLSGAKNYQIIKGWFSDTLAKFSPDEKIAILRLDGDWYDSTMECLDYLYKFVSEGGLILIDDYYTWDGCAKAIHDFLSKNKISARIHESNYGVCYLIKP